MKLTSVHQLLVVMAMGLAAIFALRAVYFAISGGDAMQALMALGSLAALVFLLRYLRQFRAKLAAAASGPADREAAANSGSSPSVADGGSAESAAATENDA